MRLPLTRSPRASGEVDVYKRQAQRMWDNSKTVTLTAPNPGNDDVRYIVLGMIDGKHWTAITTKRGKRIRIISVRRSRKNEEAYYDSQE